MAENVDDMIVCLMSMGFDISQCQDAVNFGKKTVESAVDWLVAGKPGFKQNPTPEQTSGASLKLRPTTSTFGTSNIPFSAPKPIPSDSATSDQSQPRLAGQSESSNVEIDQPDEETAVVSRLHMSDNQRKYKENFEVKKRDEAKKQALLEKRKHKEEHARVLKEIAEDREKKKLLTGSRNIDNDQASADTDPPKVKEQKIETATQSNKDQSGKCLLQIRLPDGRSLRQSFNVTATLREVWDYTELQQKHMDGLTFIQPFPRHEYSRSEMGQSLTDLRLTPTGSLVLQKTQVKQPSDMDVSESQSEVVIPDPPAPPTHNQHSGGQQSHRGGRQAHTRGHKWGQGHALETEAPVQGEDDESEAMDDDEEAGPDDMVIPGLGGLMGHGMGQGMGQGFPHMGGGAQIGGHAPPLGNVMGQGHDIFGMAVGGEGQQGVFGGEGQRLMAEGDPGNDAAYQQRSARELAFERAQARLAQPVVGPSPSPSTSTSSSPGQVTCVVSLVQHCLRHITHRLNDPRHQLLSLSGISEDMAQLILNHLLKEKQLKSRSLNPFIPCYLRKLVLDCYPYATNELLHAVRLHTNLSHLSLSSCPLITDAGMQHLTTLKKVKRLNLSSCKQLSNIVNILTSMPNLVSLNLEDTGVTDAGVIQYLACRPQHLQYLNLSRTSVTQAIFPHIQTCAIQLKSLGVEGTKVVSLSGIQDLIHLESLNVARTHIVTESLLCLVNHPTLMSLSIADTENLNGDQALQDLKGLHLNTLTLASRLTTTNVGMRYLADFPLLALDLTNYIYITDEGIEHIAKITSLKKLLLGNTKLTDAGMLFLETLTDLEVLNIDRTLVTDEGAGVVSALTHLVDLSMASSGVSTKFLLKGSLNSCTQLTKLNLSKTRVTSKGILSLQLPFLQMLSVDGTKVSPDLTVAMVTGCPQLCQMSSRNLELFTRDDEVEEAEMMDT